MSQYSTGLSSVTNGSATVTGTNTLWLANVTAGDSFTVAGDGVMYDVASVDSDTQITLSVNYAGTTASGAVYAIGTGFTVPDSFPEMSQGDIETATIFTRAMRKIQSRFTGLVSDISGKADQATTYTETEVDSLLDDKAAIAGQIFTGDIAAPKITASTGILFGTDTAAANTLDDYETGTWSPTGGNDANITGVTYSESSYTKIGGLVTISGKVTGTITSTNTETRIEVSLPFSAGSSTWSNNGVVVGFSGSGLNRIAIGTFTNAGTTPSYGFVYINGRQINDTGEEFFKYSLTYDAG